MNDKSGISDRIVNYIKHPWEHIQREQIDRVHLTIQVWII